MIYEAVLSILTLVGTILGPHIREEVRLWCHDELIKLKSSFESILAVLADAENRREGEEAVNLWISRIVRVSREADDVLWEWFFTVERAKVEGGGCGSRCSLTTKVCSLFDLISRPFGCSHIVVIPRDLRIRIKKINKRLDVIAAEKDRYRFNEIPRANESFRRPRTTSFIEPSAVVGREVEKKNLIDRLLMSDRNLNVVSVVGWVGIGKTFLAQLLYNCDEVVNHFDKRIWVCTTDPFDEVRIAKAILEVIEGNAYNLRELEPVVTKIRDHIRGNKFFLVLDDVCTEGFQKWEHLFESLKTGEAGSTILVTTRKESVARVMGSSYQLRLGCLSEGDSWTLFEKTALFDKKEEDRERLDVVGRKVAEKCGGSPLAIKILGNEMRGKKSLSDWERVLDSEFWELKAGQKSFEQIYFKSCYVELPPSVRRCFLLCAIFPRDHVIEANVLVQLWMAHGYLTSTGNVEVEEEAVGQDYLQNLAMRSFFKDVVRDKKNGERIVSVKMHDMARDFAQYLAKNECSTIKFNSEFQGKMESSHKGARHLTVVHAEDTQFPSFPNEEKLFTLWVRSFYDSPSVITQPDRFEPDFIRRLSYARALDFSRNRIGDLPREIGSLFMLKFLNLSHNPFWELPDTVCDLYNLQSLKLSACELLRRLPPRIYKLVNLRHLEIDGTDNLTMLPKGIADLASLRTLNKFIVPRTNDRSNVGACDLGDLKNLNKLRGSLKIEGLGHATDAAEAKKAELGKKIHLSHLEMDFSPAEIQNPSQDAVIEALEAPQNLESLQITYYQGTQLPKWMMKLTKLQFLLLKDCHNCTSLPPLGTWTSLETLHLEGMNTLKCLNLGSAFPNLTKLKVSKMESWEEWNVMSGDQTSVNSTPHLRCLEISHCSKLRAIPRLLLRSSPLRKLLIDHCLLLHQLYNKETGEHWSDISHISKITVS